MILGAILEAIGIGAILPLISIMGNPDFLTVYPKVTKYAGIFGIMTHIHPEPDGGRSSGTGW